MDPGGPGRDGAWPGEAIYGDLDRPGVSQVARALQGVLGLGSTLLWPMALAGPGNGAILRDHLETFRELLIAVDLEEGVAIPPELGVPIAERLPLCGGPRTERPLSQPAGQGRGRWHRHPGLPGA